MKAWQIVSVLLALVLVGAAACNPFGGGDQEETGPQLVEVVRGDLTVSISGSGSIEVAEEAKSSFGVGGRIEKIYVEEGDRVSMGDVLAELDTGDLELALTQSKVTLAKQQLAVSQQEVAITKQQVALAKQEVAVSQQEVAISQQEVAISQQEVAITKQQVALAKQEVAVTQAEVVVTQEEVDLKTAIYDLEMTQDLYTWSDIKIAQADVDVAERDLEYALEQLYKYLPLDEQGDYPRIDEEFTKLPGYKVWQERVVHAQSRLNTAKNTLDAMLSGSDTEQVAIKRHSVELAEQSLELAQHSVELARQSLEQEQKSLEQEQKSLEQEQKSLEQEQKSLEVTKQALEQAKQSVDQAQKQLDKATLTAPFGGVIADVAVDEGDTVSTTVTIIHLMDLTSMELQVEVDEIDIPVVKPGQKAIIEVDALPEFKLEGEVISIGLLPVVEAGIVSYEVTVGLNASEDSGLKVGMAATVDIITEERSGVLLVPNRVVAQDRQGNPVVGVMIDGQVQERVVVTGISDDTHTEIVEGLQEGDVAVQETRAKPESSGPGFFFGG